MNEPTHSHNEEIENPNLESKPPHVSPAVADDGDGALKIGEVVEKSLGQIQQDLDRQNDRYIRMRNARLEYFTIHPRVLWVIEQGCRNGRELYFHATRWRNIIVASGSTASIAFLRLGQGDVSKMKNHRSVQRAVKKTEKVFLAVEDSMDVGFSEEGIFDKARQLKAAGNLAYMAIDSYQELANKAWSTTRILKSFKKLAEDLEVPMVILSRPPACAESEGECGCRKTDDEIIEKYAERYGIQDNVGSYTKDGETFLVLRISRNKGGKKGYVDLWFGKSLQRINPVDLRKDLAEFEKF